MAVNRKCICCGAKFEYCPSCDGKNEPWKRVYDCEDCRDIAHILIESRGSISKAEAKKQMEKYPKTLEKVFKYDSLTANSIKELFGVKDEVPADDIEVKEETPVIVEEAVPEEKQEDVSDEENASADKKPEKQKYYSSRKNK